MRALIKLLDSLRHHGTVLALALLCAGTGLAHAQTTSGDDSPDPPSRVARLSWVAGDLGLLPAGASDWSDASVNRPLTTGDKLSSGDNARAEVELGGATLRLDQRTDVGLLNLNEQLAQVELTQGSLNLSVRHLDAGQSYEIDTPTVALVINQPGRFRVDIEGNTTRVSALEGNATVYGENNAQREVFGGRSYRFVDSSLAAVTISDISGGDGFDAWVAQREQRYAQTSSDPYVSEDMVGTPDLRQYGAWENSSDYGAVWYPNDVGVDWAPYRDGHWAYIAPWGWTWIDAMPWGYAPYHYGRWAHTHRGWGWIPGPRYARPIYAPALVAFVGGGGFSVGIGSGPIGWFPLGPGEIYNPWYRSNRDYYRRVNVTNIRVTRNITNITINNRINNHYDHYRNNRPLTDERYVNRGAPNGLSAMPGRQFAAGDRVQRNLVRVDPRQLASARVVPRGVDVRPLPRGRYTQPSAHVRQLPVNGFQREVVARHAPAEAAERRAGPTNNLAGPRAGVMPGSNVRVLNPRAGIANNPRPAVDERTDSGNQGARLPRASNITPNAPIVQRRSELAERAPRGDLPSARFAHSASPEHAEPAPMPRPGVSYISGANEDARRPEPRTGANLPQVPRVQRAGAIEQPPASGNARAQRYPIDPQRSTIGGRDNPQPRFERPEPGARNYRRDQTGAQPARREAPQQVMQQPRYQPQRQEQPRYEQPRFVQPQRAEPPPRAEAPRNAARPESRPEPRKQKDGQQQ
ncbi:MAG: DUF6600 domain-containing protein [Rhodanobacter sp.]